MSEYELMSLLGQYGDSLGTRLGLFASILFAYLVAVFLATEKLPRWIMLSITAIYTLFTLLTTLSIFTNISRANLVREDILRLYPNSESLLIQEISGTALNLNFYMIMYILVLVGSYLGSILFLKYELQRTK